MTTTENIISALNQVAAEVGWVASELTGDEPNYPELESEIGERVSQLQAAQNAIAELAAEAQEAEWLAEAAREEDDR